MSGHGGGPPDEASLNRRRIKEQRETLNDISDRLKRLENLQNRKTKMTKNNKEIPAFDIPEEDLREKIIKNWHKTIPTILIGCAITSSYLNLMNFTLIFGSMSMITIWFWED